MLAQYIGRKNATLVEMGMIVVALLFGYFFVNSYNNLLAMGVLLGIAGASFGVALSPGLRLVSRRATRAWPWAWSAPATSGTALSVLVAPPLAQRYGWQAVYGIAAVAMLLPMVVMILFAKEPPDVDKHPACASTSPACSKKTAGPSA